MELDDTAKALLRRHPRALYHLRSQLARRKLMPLFGAGASRPLDFPGWDDLIDRIQKHSSVDGVSLDLRRASQVSRTQLLFQHYRQKNEDPKAPPNMSQERKAHVEWIRIVHECLYATAKSATSHPYLYDFLPVVRLAPLTVNYNFDDTIEQLLDVSRPSGTGQDNRGFETVWHPTVQYRYDSTVIYHPNGFLPRDLTKGASERIVFAEDRFADQLIDSQRGHYSTLLSHLFRFTGLLIGLSLDDPTLKHLLRQSLHANPGHVHYYVAYVADDDKTTAAQRETIRYSNFESYNLVTLHLTTQEMKSLGVLLSLAPEEFALHAHEQGLPKAFTFYLSGPVGVGKTSCLAHFKSLNSFDEWLDPKPSLLARAVTALNEGEEVDINKWIEKQFSRRNYLVSGHKSAINVVDRSPLDPLAFAGVKNRRTERAQELGPIFSTLDNRVVEGQVLFMRGNPEVLHQRVYERHKDADSTYIKTLQNQFEDLWSRVESPSVRTVDTVDMSLFDAVRTLARLIHLGEYKAAPLQSLLFSVMDSNTST